MKFGEDQRSTLSQRGAVSCQRRTIPHPASGQFRGVRSGSLGEQIEEIEVEIKEYTLNLDSIMGAEMTTPLVRIILHHVIKVVFQYPRGN